MTMFQFDVIGDPKPQGSKRAHVQGGRAIMREQAGQALTDWRSAVAAVARQQLDPLVPNAITDACTVEVTFRLAMPKGRDAATRRRGYGWRTSTPDVDKLARSTLDSLVHAGLIADDALVVRLAVQKVEVWQQWTGARITVHTTSHVEAP